MSASDQYCGQSHRVLNPGEQITAGLCALAIMTKAPRVGRVKTRLQPPLTLEEAAELNVCFLRDTASTICEVSHGTMPVAVYTPIGYEADYSTILPPEFLLLPQRGSDFGERLVNAVEDLLNAGFESCCLIDSDSPTVTPDLFTQAARYLRQTGERIVLGPSEDGGYYLIGMKQLYPELFQEIDWSTEWVCQQTLARAAKLGLEVHQLPVAFDVDDWHGLRRLCAEVIAPGNGNAPVTRSFLEQLIAREGRERIWPQ